MQNLNSDANTVATAPGNRSRSSLLTTVSHHMPKPAKKSVISYGPENSQPTAKGTE